MDTEKRMTDFVSQFDWHLGKQILHTLTENESRINQIEVISGKEETCGSVRLRSIRAAQALKARNFHVGDVVLVCSNNHNDTCIPFIASMYIGTIPVNLVVGMTHSEVKHIVSLAKPKIIFSDPEMLDLIDNILTEISIKCEIITFGEATEKCEAFIDFIQPTGTEFLFKYVIGRNELCEDFDSKTTVAFIACSSGTTGLSKLVAINHKATYLSMLALMYFNNETAISLNSKFHEVIYFNLSPMYWISGIISMLGSCLFGNIRLQMAQPSLLENIKPAIEKFKPHGVLFSPFIMSKLTKDPDFEKVDFSSLRVVYTGGSMVDYDTIKYFEKKLPHINVVVAYGATETGLCCANPGFKYKSVGKMISWYKWKVVDVQTEKEVGPNEPGELRLKSDYVMKYYNDEKSTAVAFDDDGYFKTGDLFYYDDNGYFYIIDRIKEVIKYCNYQISTSEIESLINHIPEVVSTAVIGIPHATFGELPIAFVQKLPGSKLSEQEIQEYVKQNLSDCKQLRGGVVFMDELPQTHSGKINRKYLRTLRTTKAT